MDQVKQTAGCEATLEDRTWLNAYVLALSKWLLGLMLSSSYKVTVRLLTSYSYGVMSSGCDMASLAFFFEPGPISRTDGSGLTGIGTEHDSVFQEVELAAELIDAVADIQDVDAMLAGSEELMEKYIDKTIALLRPLRYDADAYRNFALGRTGLS